MKFAPEVDFTDVLVSSFGGLLLRFFLVLGAIWVGLFAGELATIAGGLVAGQVRSPLLELLKHPYEAILIWVLPGIMGLGAVWLKFGRMDGSGTILWGVFTGVVAIARVAIDLDRLDDTLPVTAALGTCVVLIGMISTGLWFLRQWQMNRWAVEMAMLQSENAARRAELSEKFGTDNPDPEPIEPI